MPRRPAPRAVLLEQGRITDPRERPRRRVDQAAAMADLQPGGTEQLAGVAGRTGSEEHAVRRARADRGAQPGPLGLRQVPGDRPGAGHLAAGIEQDVAEPAGTARACPLLPAVKLLARLRG